MSINASLNSMEGLTKDYAGYNEDLAKWLDELKAAGIITGFVSEFVAADRPHKISIGMTEDKKNLVLNGVGLYEKQKELAKLYGLDISADIMDIDEDESYLHFWSADYFRRKYSNS